jgi:hypothetical protein
MTDRDLMQQALEALIWTTGSDDFGDGGKAREGALKLLYPSITALRERLVQPEMEPCAGRNCGSTNPNLHSAECFEDYEKSTGMNQWQGLTDQEINSVCYKRDWTAPWTNTTFARAIEEKLKEKNT